MVGIASALTDADTRAFREPWRACIFCVAVTLLVVRIGRRLIVRVVCNRKQCVRDLPGNQVMVGIDCMYSQTPSTIAMTRPTTWTAPPIAMYAFGASLDLKAAFSLSATMPSASLNGRSPPTPPEVQPLDFQRSWRTAALRVFRSFRANSWPFPGSRPTLCCNNCWPFAGTCSRPSSMDLVHA